ncbi:MAG: hypothetical protein AAGI38_21675 [Bacteroidota bacterium]
MQKYIITLLCLLISSSQAFAQSDINLDVTSLTELNQRQKLALDKILTLEREITQLESERKSIEEKIDNHFSEDYFETTSLALEEAKNKGGDFKGSLRDHLDYWGIRYENKSEIDRELQKAKKIKASQPADIEELRKVNGQLEKQTLELNNANLSFENIGREIDKLMSELDQKNEFRLWMSVTFSVLVALVIAGFFLIVVKKENISADIFSGEKGIQFITLFLIIIAVILFGIMGILESRELSALLGALSGYILGRTNPGSGATKNKEP